MCNLYPGNGGRCSDNYCAGYDKRRKKNHAWIRTVLNYAPLAISAVINHGVFRQTSLYFLNLREDYLEPLCWECWKDVKAAINRVEEEQLKREKNEHERLAEQGNSIGMKFTLIPAGEFMMGSEEHGDEKPVHKVRGCLTIDFVLKNFPSFWI